MRQISRLTAAMALAIAGTASMSAQAFFTLNAGTDGFNASFSNAYPYYAPAVVVAPPPPPRHHHHHHHERVCVPMLPGWDYPVISPKQYRKAVKRYRKEASRGRVAGAIPLPGGGGIMVSLPIGGGRDYYDYDEYYDYDDDDYEDYMKARYKYHKKMYKKYKKARKHYKKHHKHHRHHHDDDD